METIANAARTDRLLSALGFGDMDEVRRAVDEMLDAGQGQALQDALEAAGERLTDDAVIELSDILTEETQKATLENGEVVRLFAVPVLIERTALRSPSYPGIGHILASHVSRGERLVMVDGWCSLEDLLTLDPVRFRQLARSLAAAGDTAAATAAAADCLPSLRGAASTGGRSIYMSGSERISAVLVSPRFAIGAVIHAADARETTHGIAAMAAGDLNGSALTSLFAAIEQSIPGVFGVLEPEAPILAALSTRAVVDLMNVDARLEAARAELGVKPLTHVHVGDDSINFVMLGPDGSFVDALEVEAAGIDPEKLADIVAHGSAEVHDHDDISTLPRYRAAALH